MKSPYVTSRLSRLIAQSLRQRSLLVVSATRKSRAFFAGYIVVFASGIYEDCIEHLFTEFAKKYGNTDIAFFMSKMLISISGIRTTVHEGLGKIYQLRLWGGTRQKANGDSRM